MKRENESEIRNGSETSMSMRQFSIVLPGFEDKKDRGDRYISIDPRNDEERDTRFCGSRGVWGFGEFQFAPFLFFL